MQARVILAGITALVIAAAVIAALWYRGQAISAEADAIRARASLALAQEANKQAIDTIAAMQAQAERDGRLTAELVDEMRRINEGLADQAEKLTELERSNADVRAYLDSLVPDDLRRLRGR